MFLCPANVTFLLAKGWRLFREDRFLGKVLDARIADSQEFVNTKLPRAGCDCDDCLDVQPLVTPGHFPQASHSRATCGPAVAPISRPGSRSER